jgi:hypothetical protein
MTTEEQKVSYVCIDQETPECATAVASWTVSLSWDTYTQKWEIDAQNYEDAENGPYCTKCDGDMEKVDLQPRTWGLNAKCQLHGPDHPEYLCPVLNQRKGGQRCPV